ncbi:hypothetical protein GC089_14860 [Cellulomonas sp. JZ18]|uniref:CAP domain-containing protein n=1 Tax=Cellulomonas sp. JZ18 TaxID=2654191 RepID=UPI0012D49F78|nr:hypothetical protein [Cellulomonas sp. JZ18]QGQ20244.1 hypothetical protein GC089_14860 [Cellulomonas sp. JZ18]
MSGRQDSGARPDTAAGTGTTGVPGLPTQAGPVASAPAPVVPTQAGPAVSAPTPLVPTQAGPVASAPTPVVPTRAARPASAPPAAPRAGDLGHVPQQRPAGVPPRPQRARRATALVATAAVLATAGTVWAADQDHRARAAAEAAADARVAAAVQASAADVAAPRADTAHAGAAVATGQRADVAAATRAAADRAVATLAASAQAGDGPRATLQQAVDAASGALGAPAVSLTTLRATTAAIAAPEQAVVEAQAAWQAAEDARLAAERAAAEQAAAAAAARASARGSGTAARAPRASAPRPAAPRAAAPARPGAAAAPAPAPAAGLPVAGSVVGVGDVGAALNAHRAANGLGGLSIVSSGARAEHAMQMAASDSIWHSGTRAGSPKARPEIVGRVSPASASRMIAAYAASDGHNRQMLGSYSTAYIGVVLHDGWMYTSITFG